LNIVNIALKEIKRDFRDIRTLVFMLAFPIILMLILGTALSNAFDSQVSIGGIHVLYKDHATGGVSQSFQGFAKQASQSDIQFKQAKETTDGKKEVIDGKYDAYVEINKSGIQLYQSEQSSIEASIVQGMLKTFTDKYNLVAQVSKVAPGQVPSVLTNGNHDQYIKETSLNSPKQPGSMDYYAIAMTTMIALYAAMGASYLVRGERVLKTADRLMTTPVSRGEILIGKILGSLVLNSLCVLIVVVFSKFAFKANWGEHLGLVLLILLSEVFLAVAFGLGISYITKTGAAANMIIMITVQLASMFGGAYYKISDTSGIAGLSPLTWANTAITKIIYSNDLASSIPVLSLNLGISAIFLAIVIFSLRRREGL
jgi:ABC-2 type transport system permease protein